MSDSFDERIKIRIKRNKFREKFIPDSIEREEISGMNFYCMGKMVSPSGMIGPQDYSRSDTTELFAVQMQILLEKITFYRINMLR